jgi:predicted dehydrogenase
MSLKVAIVGCGKIADAHVEEIAKLKTGRVVAVCDLEMIMAEQLATRYGLPRFYDDLERLLDVEKPDVLHVTTPPQSHVSLVAQAVDAGCHVYVEKPVALTFKDAKEIVSRVEGANKKMTVGLAYYFDPIAVAMRGLAQERVLGDIVHVESFFGYDLAGDFGRSVLGNAKHWVHGLPGKLFQNNLDHPLGDIVEFVEDSDPRVHAVAYRSDAQRFGDSREELFDELRVTLTGKRTSAYCTFSSHTRPRAHYCRVFGTARSIQADYVSRTLTATPESRLPGVLGRLLLPFSYSCQFSRQGGRNLVSFLKSDFHFFAGMNRLISLFYASVIGESPPPIPYEKILRSCAIQDAIYEQIRPASSERKT